MNQETQPYAHSKWPSTIVLGCAAAVVLHVVWNIIFNIYLHPLSSCPGPLICKISRIPYWISTFRGRQIYFMKGLHDKYGPVLRFSPNELSFTNAQAWKDICAFQKGRPENLKAPSFQYVFILIDQSSGRYTTDQCPSLETYSWKDGSKSGHHIQ